MNKAIEATRKMLEVTVKTPDKSKKTIMLRKNQIRQKIMAIIEDSN